MVTHVHCHHTDHALWVAHGKFVAKDAAPVVQHQGHGLVGTDVVHDLTQELAHVVQAGRSRTGLKTRQGQAGANGVLLQSGYGAVPQGTRVGPAMQQEQDLVALPLQPNFGAVDGDGLFSGHVGCVIPHEMRDPWCDKKDGPRIKSGVTRLLAFGLTNLAVFGSLQTIQSALARRATPSRILSSPTVAKLRRKVAWSGLAQKKGVPGTKATPCSMARLA